MPFVTVHVTVREFPVDCEDIVAGIPRTDSIWLSMHVDWEDGSVENVRVIRIARRKKKSVSRFSFLRTRKNVCLKDCSEQSIMEWSGTRRAFSCPKISQNISRACKSQSNLKDPQENCLHNVSECKNQFWKILRAC